MMNKIEVCLSPKLFDEYSLENKIVVIVDILRATTIITTMFNNGVSKVIPVNNLEDARVYKEKGYLLVAERNGKKVDFADFDNSPFSFKQEIIEGKTLVYSTLNGTNTINIARNAEKLIIASFLNLSAVVNHLKNKGKDVLIVCSGWKGNYCIEDVLYAGALSVGLIRTNLFNTNCDSVISSIDLWGIAQIDLHNYIKKTFQYKRLTGLGLNNIIDYCFNIDLTTVIPVFYNDYIINVEDLT